jgi:long-chain fatty acid transport protein
MMKLKITKRNLTGLMVIMLSLTMFSFNAFATDGYFSNGQGTRSKGMAGAGIAFLNSPFSASINPAGIVFPEKKWSLEVSVGLFNPNRQYEIIGAYQVVSSPSQFPG